MTKTTRRPRLTDETARAELLEHGLEMVGSYAGTTHRPQPSRCIRCGSDTSPRIDALRRGQGGCVACGIVKRAASKSITEDEARDEYAAYGLELVEPWTGSAARPHLVRCALGHKGRPRLRNLRQGEGGCLVCGKAGGVNVTTLSRNETWAFGQSWAYLKEVTLNDGRTVVKVGIGTEARARGGAKRVLALVPLPLVHAFRAEQAILATAGRRVVAAQDWPLQGGRTEVVANERTARAMMRRYAAEAGRIREEESIGLGVLETLVLHRAEHGGWTEVAA